MSLTSKQGQANSMSFGKAQEDFNNKFQQMMAEKRKQVNSRLVLGVWGQGC